MRTLEPVTPDELSLDTAVEVAHYLNTLQRWGVFSPNSDFEPTTPAAALASYLQPEV